MGYWHKGWSLSYSASRPVTGMWVAVRYGVELCAHSRTALLNVIDNHEEDLRLSRKEQRRAADELPERDFYEGDAPDY